MASCKARIIICATRWRRSGRGERSPALIKRESGTCPAVLHRHRSTSKDFTGVTQSRPARKADEVSSRPNPRGLTTPAATTATRGFGDFGEEEKSAIFGGGTGPELICFHRQKP